MRIPDMGIVNDCCNKPIIPARSIGYTLVVAAVLGASGVAILSNNEAGAMGGYNPAAAMLQANIQIPDLPPAASTSRRRVRLFEPRRTERSENQHREVLRTGLAVCVRLCDGSFFPSNTDSGGDAACKAQCPDAPTALYMVPASGRIEDAVSTSSALYSDLPVAGRYRTVLNSTCACHRGRVSYSAMLLLDRTLRKGDAVMTPKGIVVYEGANSSSTRPEDFIALAQERRLPGDVREYLSKMQSTLIEVRQVADYLAATSTSTVSPAARKGSIWIDSPSTSSR
jgi:hypothetical protein